jgi:hypothetical protein
MSSNFWRDEICWVNWNWKTLGVRSSTLVTLTLYVLPYIEHCLSTCLMLATWHHIGRLTCLVDSLAWQTHLLGRITCLADSLSWQTHLPGSLIARQTHLPGRPTGLVDSLAWQTHLLVKSLAWQTHYLGRLTCPTPSRWPNTYAVPTRYWMELCREACWVKTISTG